MRPLVNIGDWFSLGRRASAINAAGHKLGEVFFLPPGEGDAVPADSRWAREIRTNNALRESIRSCAQRMGSCPDGKIDAARMDLGGSLSGAILLAAPVDAQMRLADQTVVAVAIDRGFFTERVKLIMLVLLGMMAVCLGLCAVMTLMIQRRYVVKPIEQLAAMIRLGKSHEMIGPRHHEVSEVGAIRRAIQEAFAEIERQHAERQAFEASRVEGEKNAAIARMTQMLAHDVRKPFSILRMGLGMLGKAKDTEGVKRILGGLVPEIEKATSSVDGLISDVMEVGSNSTELIQEPVSPESLIEATLGEIFCIYPKADVSVSYDLCHSHMVSVHARKIGRVFSNIVGNAVQAMNRRGHIWFHTSEANGLVQFCLGNAGSFIPAESLPRLFEAFFTSGKKGGTGLGLAIAEKVIKAHGGTIWCESSRSAEFPDGKVEFFFNLPIATGRLCAKAEALPKHSSEVIKVMHAMAQSLADQDGLLDQSEVFLEDEIAETQARMGRAIQILIIDDESVYRRALTAHLTRTEKLAPLFAITEASGSPEAFKALAATTFDLIITDIDMGRDSTDGFELVRSLRAGGHDHEVVCVHSNRMMPADQTAAIEAGADAFIPKPMARGQLLKLVAQALRKPATANQEKPNAAGEVRPVVAVADDNPFILDAWIESLAADATVIAVDSPEALLARLDEEPGLLGRLHGVIVDQNFDNSGQDGVTLGRELKSRRSNLPVLLSSDGVYGAEELAGGIDRIIAKSPVRLDLLGLV